MGSYSTIADTSKSLLELLRKRIVPEPIPKAELIGLCPPNDRGNFTLGLYLYNVEENIEMRSGQDIIVDMEHVKSPPMSLTLYYMLYAISNSDSASKQIDEQRILGRAIQELKDNRRIDSEYLIGTLKENNEVIDVNNINISLDEKIRIWSLFNEPYRLSMFYKVGPIFIESNNIRKVRRVREADMRLIRK